MSGTLALMQVFKILKKILLSRNTDINRVSSNNTAFKQLVWSKTTLSHSH